MGAFWGSLTALFIGMSELTARRVVNVAGVLTASVLMQVVSTATAAVTLLFVASTFGWADVGWGALSGLCMGVGLGSYFSGLVRSSSTIVAPIVATLSAILPFSYTLLRGAEASNVAIMGAVVSFVGLAFIAAGVVEVTRLKDGVLWGVLSGLGYGVGTSVLVEASDASGSWPAVTQRLTSALLLGAAAVTTKAALVPPRGQRLLSVGAGMFAGMTSVFLLIGLSVDAAPTVVTASMFPAVSVVVGFFFFGDPVVRRQIFGIALVLAGVVAVVTA